jgi:hypothetical protein
VTLAARADWNPLTEPRDRCLIGGHITPGICDIEGANSPREWLEVRGPGLSGAILRFRGVMPSHFTIKFRLYTTIDWADWNAFQVLVAKPPFGKRPRALDIVHPLLEPLGIRSIVVEDVLAPEQTGDSGEWTATLKVIESRARKSVPQGKVDGSQQTPTDPYEQIEAEQSKIIDKLSHELFGP